MNVDARIDRQGWPETKEATGWRWREAEFSHEKSHKDDIHIDINRNDGYTIKIEDTKHIVQFAGFFRNGLESQHIM